MLPLKGGTVNDDYRTRHSEFQIDNFILTKGNWTTWGMYRQCLREVDSRERTKCELEEQLELLELDVSELESEGGAIDKRKAIELRGKRRGVGYLKREIAENERELSRFREHEQRLKEIVGELTDERRSELEADHWATKTRLMAAIDLATVGSIQPNTIPMILCLPAEIRLPILKDIKATVSEARLGKEGPLNRWLLEDLPQIPEQKKLP